MLNRITLPIRRLISMMCHKAVRSFVLPVLAPAINVNVKATLETRGAAQFTKITTVKMSHLMNRSPFNAEEKIRIVFLFQAASFWPSWESLWDACLKDDEIEPIMLVCDDPIKEKVQFSSARTFLEEKKIPFRHISEVHLDEIKPHIVILHTPYDSHRPKYLHAPRLTANGYRVVYITYGIEISDSSKARSDHFQNNVTTIAWRVYTFSEDMIPEYKLHSPTGGDMVRSLGHPKFDGLVNMHESRLPEEIIRRAKGRKIVLWKVHFPKKVAGKTITPEVSEYIKFAKILNKFDGLFFVFMPHPKFYEEFKKFGDVAGFRVILERAENVYEFTDDEYREVLLNCDFYMIDRSALMIEAGITGKPILYLQNHKYSEPMTTPVQSIIDSYYQADSCLGMKEFIQTTVLADHDPKFHERHEAFDRIFSGSLDGLSGTRIKNDMKATLEKEASLDTKKTPMLHILPS